MPFGFSFARTSSAFVSTSPHEVGDLSGYRVLDVRGPDEFHGPLGHLPGAELLPVSVLPSRLDSLSIRPDERVLVVCRSGARSAQAAAFLASRGYQRVHNLTGGMMAWRREGRDACGEPHGPGFPRCTAARG